MTGALKVGIRSCRLAHAFPKESTSNKMPTKWSVCGGSYCGCFQDIRNEPSPPSFYCCYTLNFGTFFFIFFFCLYSSLITFYNILPFIVFFFLLPNYLSDPRAPFLFPENAQGGRADCVGGGSVMSGAIGWSPCHQLQCPWRFHLDSPSKYRAFQVKSGQVATLTAIFVC